MVSDISIWVFPKIMGFPQIIHFRVFHYKPSILGVPLFSETPIYIYIYTCIYVFYFHPDPWGKWYEMIQFDEHMFQMGWFNHHLVENWRGGCWGRWYVFLRGRSQQLYTITFPTLCLFWKLVCLFVFFVERESWEGAGICMDFGSLVKI